MRKCIVPKCPSEAEHDRKGSTCAAHWGCCAVCGGFSDQRHDNHDPEDAAFVDEVIFGIKRRPKLTLIQGGGK